MSDFSTLSLADLQRELAERQSRLEERQSAIDNQVEFIMDLLGQVEDERRKLLAMLGRDDGESEERDDSRLDARYAHARDVQDDGRPGSNSTLREHLVYILSDGKPRTCKELAKLAIENGFNTVSRDPAHTAATCLGHNKHLFRIVDHKYGTKENVWTVKDGATPPHKWRKPGASSERLKAARAPRKPKKVPGGTPRALLDENGFQRTAREFAAYALKIGGPMKTRDLADAVLALGYNSFSDAQCLAANLHTSLTKASENGDTFRIAEQNPTVWDLLK